jgi:type IV pilus assembly protein PilM
MAKRVVTLYISDEAINLLVLEGRSVKQWANMPLEAGLVKEGLILDEEKVAGEINKIFSAAGVGTRRVIAGINGLNSLYRLVSLPTLPEAILPEAIRKEAKRVIPVPLEEVYLSYQRLAGVEGEIRVFLAAFPRAVADAIYRTLSKANVVPYIMELAPLALSRLANAPRAIVVGSRQDHLDIVILSEGLPNPIRTISLPGEAAGLVERLPVIAEEIDRTVAFYNSSHKDNPLSGSIPIFVCGDLTQVPDKWPVLAGNLKFPVSALPSPVDAPAGFETNDYVINIGLGLHEIMPAASTGNVSQVDMNSLPETYRPKPIKLTPFILPAVALLGAVALGFMGFQLQHKMQDTKALRAEVPPIEKINNQLAKDIAGLQAQVKQAATQADDTFARVQPLNDTANVFTRTFQGLDFERKTIDAEVNAMIDLRPSASSFSLITLHDEDKLMKITGKIDTADLTDAELVIYDYAKNLRIKFGEVTVSSIKAVLDDTTKAVTGYQFELLVHGG